MILHIFSNGRGFFDLGKDIRPEQVQHFKEWWEREGKDIKAPEKLFFAGVEIEVVEHPMPFGGVDVREDR